MKKVDANGDPLGDQASGEITLVNAPAVGFRTITIRLTRAASPNEFASGILRDSQNRNFWITGNSATDGNMLATFTIIDTGAPANGPATAYQDDFGVGDVRYSPFFNSTAAAVAAGANPGEWVITLNTDLPANEQDGFVDGLFFVENGPPLSIVSHTTGAGTSITVQAQQQPIQQGANVILVRPVSHEAPTTIVDPSDDGHLYEMMQASTVRAENRFADAYFEPRTDTLDAHISDVPGVTHLADNAVDFPQVFNPLRSAEKTKLFWTVQVSTAYEGRASKDLDPQTEGNSVLAFSNNYSTAIFLETIRDLADLLRATSESEMIARTTVHEVGHQFDIAAVPLEHRDDVPNIMMSGILVDNNNDPIGGSLLIPDNQFYFAAADIAFLRMREQSPGAVV